MVMPNVGGMDILRDIHSKEVNTQVVVLTGISDADIAAEAMKLGAFNYLIKPVDEEKLLEVLNNTTK